VVRTRQRAVRQSATRRAPALRSFTGALVAALVVLTTACGDDEPPSPSEGSGVSVTDTRDVASFTAVELTGANTVTIRVGEALSVAVTGDDNLVDRVTTVVRDDRLVIDDTGSFETTAPMSVAVSVPALDVVTLSGAGTVTVEGVDGDQFSAELAGDGTLQVGGTAQRSTAVLAGAGTLDLARLVAADATAELAGTGTIRINATSTLDASLSGTGTILYHGDPTATVHNTGTGTVAAG
jgi:hypothetical protein